MSQYLRILLDYRKETDKVFRVRIEHAGYDQEPLTFTNTINLADFLSSVARSKEFNGKIYYSLEIVEDEDNE